MQLTPTQDGSWTCFNEQVGEHYHNLHGAYSEAISIYIHPMEMAGYLAKTSHIRVVDPFFGLGYNSLACISHFLQLRATQFPEARLTLVAFERDPQILAQIPQAIRNSGQDDLKQFLPHFEHNIYYQTHGDPSREIKTKLKWEPLGIDFRLYVGDTRQMTQSLPDGAFDVVFHDAFSPRKQPELWTTQLFCQYARILSPSAGRVLTYSAASPVRNAFLDAGFSVYPLHSSNFKSGTLASKVPLPAFTPLSPLEQALLSCKSGLPYEDHDTLSLAQAAIIENRNQRILQSDLPSSSSIHRQFGYYNARQPKTKA